MPTPSLRATHLSVFTAGLVLAGLIGWPTAAGSAAPVELKITPTVARAPARIDVTATIERHAGNRRMVIEAESADFFRSSEIQLDGAEAPHAVQARFNNLPPGHYFVTATLFNDQGNFSIERRLQVIGPGADLSR